MQISEQKNLPKNTKYLNLKVIKKIKTLTSPLKFKNCCASRSMTFLKLVAKEKIGETHFFRKLTNRS
jgi:hypothetical protein